MRKQEIMKVLREGLEQRTIEQLKEDARTAMKSQQYAANLIFNVALSILEERLTPADYAAFEDSL